LKKTATEDTDEQALDRGYESRNKLFGKRTLMGGGYASASLLESELKETVPKSRHVLFQNTTQSNALKATERNSIREEANDLFNTWTKRRKLDVGNTGSEKLTTSLSERKRAETNEEAKEMIRTF
jgi:hypothetical protein